MHLAFTRHVDMDADIVIGKTASLAACGAILMGMLCACFVAFSRLLNNAFSTSNTERVKSFKLVVLSALFFIGAMILIAGASCAPDVGLRDTPVTLRDLELKDISLQLLPESVHLAFTVSLSTLVQEIGNQNSIMLAGAELRTRYVHGAKAMSLGTLGTKPSV